MMNKKRKWNTATFIKDVEYLLKKEKEHRHLIKDVEYLGAVAAVLISMLLFSRPGSLP